MRIPGRRARQFNARDRNWRRYKVTILWPLLVMMGFINLGPGKARQPETPPLDPELGSIAVEVKTIGPTALSAHPRASTVFFIRSDPDGSLLQTTLVVASDFTDKDQVYLFNVPPGKYMAVGAFTDA